MQTINKELQEKTPSLAVAITSSCKVTSTIQVVDVL